MDIFEIKNLVKDLPEREVRTYLQLILFRIGMLEDRESSLVDFANDLKEIYNHILNPKVPTKITFENGNIKKVHINFGYPYLRQTLKELKLLDKEIVMTFYDNFAVAPISHLKTEEGQRERYEWIKTNLQRSKEEINDYFDELQRTIAQLGSIPETFPIHIWVTDNAHEQTGLLFILFLLRKRRNQLFIINTGQLYKDLFKKKSKRFVPFSSGEIMPEELQTIIDTVKRIMRVYLTKCAASLNQRG